MPTFLSPSVIVRELDLSTTVVGASPILPAFIGTAKKGPLNDPTIVTNQSQFIDTFGEPFVDSNLGYAAMAYLEEGSLAYIVRVGVECKEGQVDDLASICIDTSGAMVEGWGRIPLFTGIDHGKIALRTPSATEPFSFHDASVDNINYTDIDVSSTDGPTTATLNFTISDYIGALDDTFAMLITGSPDPGEVLTGATFEVVRQSDGATVETGTLNDAGGGTSDPITLGTGLDATGLVFTVVVTGASPLEADDSFSFQAHPDNKNFAFSVEGAAAVTYSFTDGSSYTDADTFVAAFNLLLGGGESYSAVVIDDAIYVRTDTAGERIQLVGETGDTIPDTEAWALEVGTSKWTWDIPRSYLLSNSTGPFDITSQNDRIRVRIVGEDDAADVEFSLPNALATPVDVLAGYIDASGISAGVRYFESFELQTTDTDAKLVIVTDVNHQLWELQLQATASYIETLRFAEETEIPYPYKKAYRVFSDSRVVEPDPGTTDPSIPLSCEENPASADCLADTSYYANIVGFIVAKSPGTWIDSYRVTVENFVGNPGEYILTVTDSAGNVQTRYEEVSFDPDAERYIANLINAGASLAGQNGDEFISWVERDADIGEGVVRNPGEVSNGTFSGAANGIPTDAVYSSELDAAIIGNPNLATGLQSLSNPDEYDISLLVIPGNSSGAVLGQAISFCESRGDVLFLVDPPFGLRPQQVVDWHNGLLNSDLTNSLNSSYAALYWGWLEIFDQFSAQNVFVPPSGHVAAVFARTARLGESWDAPAGLNRGRLLTAVGLEYRPTKGERDLLYGLGNAVNPIANLFQEGIVVYGQRTLQRRRSALDRVNVRMLLIHLKKVLPRMLRQYLFEPNVPSIWIQVQGAIEAALADIVAREGIEAFDVIVDERNNTPERRDRNELWVSVFIKPVKAIEFIVLNLAILRSEQSFAAEEILQAAGVVGNLGGN